MSGLMACRMLRLALARIPSSRGTRLASPCSINTRMAASRTESSSLVIWVSACSIEDVGEAATGPSAAIVQDGPKKRNSPTILRRKRNARNTKRKSAEAASAATIEHRGIIMIVNCASTSLHYS